MRYGDYTVMLMSLRVFIVTFHYLIEDSILKSDFFLKKKKFYFYGAVQSGKVLLIVINKSFTLW